MWKQKVNYKSHFFSVLEQNFAITPFPTFCGFVWFWYGFSKVWNQELCFHLNDQTYSKNIKLLILQQTFAFLGHSTDRGGNLVHSLWHETVIDISMKSTEKILVYIHSLADSIMKLKKIHYRVPGHGCISSTNHKLCFKSTYMGL